MKYLKEKEVAGIVKQSVHTLRQHRSKNIGIPFTQIGRSVLYSEDDVTSYLEINKVNTTAVGRSK